MTVRRTPYPGYDVLAKWDTPSFNPQTRRVIARRLDEVPPRRFLSEPEWILLEAVSACVIPQPDRSAPVPIVPWIDDMLFHKRGEGFRHDDMPPQQQAWQRALAAIDAEARYRHDRSFAQLPPAQQHALLEAIARNEVEPSLWQGIPAQRFFIDVLAKTIAGIYYSHPAPWNEIGFGGPASPRGYVRLGFNERDPWEAKEIR